MLVSMTGFGRIVSDTPFGSLIIEIQTVNRKHLEIFLSLPKELNRFELEIRKWVGESITRGQVTLRAYLSLGETVIDKTLPDEKILKKLKSAYLKLAQQCGLDSGAIDLPFLLQRYPTMGQNELLWSEKHKPLLKESISKALSSTIAMKVKEGNSLSKDILSRLKCLRSLVKKIEIRAPKSVAKQRERLKARLEEIFPLSSDLDERLLREVAIFAERVDIAEEIIRFLSHLDQLEEVLQSEDRRIGRRLEFLVQEVGREVNTMGSKASDVEISHFVVDIKSELEKIREQIQNVE